jgi:hypothetical protein
MIPIMLIDELCLFVQGVVKEILLPTSQGELKTPTVHPGYLPFKGAASEDAAEYPLIIVRLLNGDDNEDGSKATVQIIVGTYGEDSQGWREVLNILERIRQSLFKTRTIAKKYRIEYPLKWEVPDEQPRLQWIASMTTNWTIAQPIEEVIYEEDYT